MVAFFVTLLVMLLVVIFIAIRIIVLPEGEFRGSCSSNSPFIQREGGSCPVCGKNEDEVCPNQTASVPNTMKEKNG